MIEPLSLLVDLSGGPVEFLVLASVFTGVLIAVIGARALLAPPDATERRLASMMGNRARGVIAPVPLRQGHQGLESVGFSRFIAPIDSRERQRVQQQLVRAGFAANRRS